MRYTEAEIEDITHQLQAIKVNGKPVFLAFINDTSVFHTIHLDTGIGTARLEFEKAPEDKAVS